MGLRKKGLKMVDSLKQAILIVILILMVDFKHSNVVGDKDFLTLKIYPIFNSYGGVAIEKYSGDNDTVAHIPVPRP